MDDTESHDEYRARPGVNWSRLKLARTSALHYRDTPPRKDTASLGMLRAVHALVLEPEHFDRDFAVYEGRRDKRVKAYQAFLEGVGSRTVLSPKDADEARTISAAVLAYPPAAALINHPGAQTEAGLYWTDETTGLACKGRADLVILISDEDGNLIEAWVIDLKTVRSCAPRQMASDAARMGYHGQLAHYAAGVEDRFGVPVTRLGLLCVEGNAPHDVALYWLDDEAQDAGRALRDSLMQTVADAERTGDYPGQCPEPAALTLPAWALAESFGDDEGATITYDED